MIDSRIKEIILKIAKSRTVSIEERLLVENLSNKDPEIFHNLKKAIYLRRYEEYEQEEITRLLGSLSLKGTFNEEHFNPRKDRLEDWFTNAPNWLRRS